MILSRFRRFSPRSAARHRLRCSFCLHYAPWGRRSSPKSCPPPYVASIWKKGKSGVFRGQLTQALGKVSVKASGGRGNVFWICGLLRRHTTLTTFSTRLSLFSLVSESPDALHSFFFFYKNTFFLPSLKVLNFVTIWATNILNVFLGWFWIKLMEIIYL